MKSSLRWPLIGALWIAEMAGSFESAMILSALGAMIAEFRDPALVGWLVTAFLIVGAAVAAIIGRLGDLYGRRRVLMLALAFAAAGSIISALSTSFTMLLVGRIMQGVTGAVLPLCVGIVRENVDKRDAPMTIGLMISGASIGTAAGLVLGGLIVDQIAWRGIFWASAGFCIAGLIAIAALVPPSSPGRPSVAPDWFSGLLFAPGVVLILLYISNIKSWGWTSAHALGTLFAGVGLVAWWWRQSLRSPNPLVDIRAFANRTVAIGAAVTALVSMSTLQITVVFSALLQAPQWTAIGLGLSATAAGLVKLPSNLTSTFAGPLGGWLAGRGGGRLAMVAGGLVTMAGWAMAWLDTSTVFIVVVELIVISFGATMLFSVAPTLVAQAAPVDRVSEMSGLLTVVRQLFLGIGAQIVATLLASEMVTQGDLHYPAPDAYRLVLGYIICICLAAIFVSLALPKTQVVARAAGAEAPDANADPRTGPPA